MQSRDVGIADECFWVAAKEIGVQVGKNPHRAITTGAAYHGLDLGISPDGHQIFSPLFILVLLEAAEPLDLGLEDHPVSGLFPRLDTAAEAAAAELRRRVIRTRSTARFQSGQSIVLRGMLRVTRSSSFLEAHYRQV